MQRLKIRCPCGAWHLAIEGTQAAKDGLCLECWALKARGQNPPRTVEPLKLFDGAQADPWD